MLEDVWVRGQCAEEGECEGSVGREGSNVSSEVIFTELVVEWRV